MHTESVDVKQLMNDSISLAKGTSEFTKRQRSQYQIFMMIPYKVIEYCQETNSAYARSNVYAPFYWTIVSYNYDI